MEKELSGIKTYASYMAIQDLACQWEKSANNLIELGKHVNRGRCRAAADTYQQCANQLKSIIRIIETLQYEESPPSLRSCYVVSFVESPNYNIVNIPRFSVH